MAVDDYFFAFCISLPSIYPAPPHNATSAINASYDKVTIGKNLLSELRHNYHLCRLGLYSQIGENRPTVFSSTLWSIISYHDNSCQNIPKTESNTIQAAYTFIRVMVVCQFVDRFFTKIILKQRIYKWSTATRKAVYKSTR